MGLHGGMSLPVTAFSSLPHLCIHMQQEDVRADAGELLAERLTKLFKSLVAEPRRSMRRPIRFRFFLLLLCLCVCPSTSCSKVSMCNLSDNHWGPN